MTTGALSTKTARGSILAVASKLTAKTVAFMATLILARILNPADFGLIAIALLAFGFLDTMRNLGVSEVLVYQQRYRSSEASTAFWIALVSGCVFAVIFSASAPLIAGFFNNTEVTGLIRVMGLLFVLEALGAVPAAIAKRDLRFRIRAYSEVSRALFKAFISIVLALSGFGVWSIVFGQIAGSVVGVAVYWKKLEFIPTFQFEKGAARVMLSYGIVLTLVGILAFSVNRMDQFIIANQLGVLQLGYFALAYTFANMLIFDLAQTAGQATISTFARVQADRSELRKYYLDTLFYMSTFGIALGLGLFFTAEYVVRVLLADKWLPIVPVLKALSINALLMTIVASAADVITATGRAKYIIYLNLGWLVISAPIILMLSKYGITAIAWGVTVMEVCALAIFLVIAMRIADHSLLDVLNTLSSSLIAGAAMGAVLYGLQYFLGDSNIRDFLMLAMLIGVGGICYLLVVVVLRPETLTQVRHVLMPKKVS